MKQQLIDNQESSNLIDIFTEQKELDYRGEHYSVRDNGAVYRHKPSYNSKARPLDEKWTFGKKNGKTGYMTVGSHRVHIIVATAFYGANDSSKLIVDHIDTNRCNNRAENLRWLTRLENALNNPATRKRIEYLCGGDINKFIENPSCLKDLSGTNQDVTWMRTVSAEEARNAYNRIMSWANHPSGKISTGSIDEWIYTTSYTSVVKHDSPHRDIPPKVESDIPIYFDSLTPNAKQLQWETPTEFPLCPKIPDEQSLEAYVANLGIGKIITKNKYNNHLVDEYELYGDKLFIRTHTNEAVLKKYSLIIISYYDGYFIHQGTTFFEERGAMKALSKSTGKEWNGEDGIDDYC